MPDGIDAIICRDGYKPTGVITCRLPIYHLLVQATQLRWIMIPQLGDDIGGEATLFQ